MYQLPEIKPRKKAKAPYKKTEAVKALEALYMEHHHRKYPNMPEAARCGIKYRDDTAGGLTQCIVAYAKLTGCFASRLNNTGIYRNGKYTRSTARRGLPDILITGKNGLSIFVEVKAGRDRMSEHQLRVQQEQKRSGGLYFVAHDFASFKSFFDSL